MHIASSAYAVPSLGLPASGSQGLNLFVGIPDMIIFSKKVHSFLICDLCLASLTY